MGKSLVAYFSPTGTTARVARALARAAGADCAEIVPETAYTPADLDWRDSASRTSREHADEAVRPSIATAPDPAPYDTVFLGFPIWWYVEPRIIDTYLEAHEFAGKVIVPFATSGSSGLGEVPTRLQREAPAATVTAGRLLNGPQSPEGLRAFAQEAVR